MVGGHRPGAGSEVRELIRSRHVAKVFKQALVELVDDDAGSVTRDQICGDRPSQGDGRRSAGRGLEQHQAERVAARRDQQKVNGAVHRHEIVAMFVADEVGLRALETPSLGSIADNRQATPETLDRVGMSQDVGQVLFFRDPANESEDDRLGIPIGRWCHVGRFEPPNVDKARGVQELPSEYAAQTIVRPA